MAKEAENRDVHVERYYPRVLAPAKEFKALAETENPEFTSIWQAVWKWYLNTFVYDLDINGAVRWESMLSIRPKAGASLDDRRAEILIRINATLPYTHRRLEQILNALCGENLYQILLDYDKYNLAVVIDPDRTLGMNRISTVLRAIVPANLTLDVVLQFMLAVEIHHRAECQQIVDAYQKFWNLGSICTQRRDGEFNRDGTTRRTGKHPDENYKDRQTHRAEIDLLVESTLTGAHTVNRRDGTHCRNGSHRRSGAYQAGLISHACTITTIKNGIEVIEYV